MADVDPNLEAAEQLEGRTVKSIDLAFRGPGPESLALDLDDGSRVYVDALMFPPSTLEIRYVSPDELFEIARTMLEEEIVDEAHKQLRNEGQIPQLYDDRHEWTELPPVSGREPAAPWITHAARVELEGGVVRIYRTSDGLRHADPSDVKRVFGVANASDISDEKLGRAIRRALTERERSAPDSEHEDS